MKINYVKKIFLILKNTNDILEYEFYDFISRIAHNHINLDDIDFITQDGGVALKEKIMRQE